MTINGILAQIDVEIAILQRARALLSGAKTTKPSKAPKAKRKMSAAGRKAIAEAQKKRWAEKKKVPF